MFNRNKKQLNKVEQILRDIRKNLNDYYGNKPASLRTLGFSALNPWTTEERKAKFNGWLEQLRNINPTEEGYNDNEEAINKKIRELELRVVYNETFAKWTPNVQDDILKVALGTDPTTSDTSTINTTATRGSNAGREGSRPTSSYEDLEGVDFESAKKILGYLKGENLVVQKVENRPIGRDIISYDFTNLRTVVEDYNKIFAEKQEIERLIDAFKHETKTARDQAQQATTKQSELENKLKEEGVSKTALATQLNQLATNNKELTKLNQKVSEEKAAVQVQLNEVAGALDRANKALEASVAREELARETSVNKEAVDKIKALDAEKAQLTKKVKDYEDWYDGTFGRLNKYDLNHTKKFYQDLTAAAEQLHFLTEDKKGVNTRNVEFWLTRSNSYEQARNLFKEILGLRENETLPDNTFALIRNKVNNASGSSDINKQSRSDLNIILTLFNVVSFRLNKYSQPF